MNYIDFTTKLLHLFNDNNTWIGKFDASGLKRSEDYFKVFREFSVKYWNAGNDMPVKGEDYFSDLSTAQLMDKIFGIYKTNPAVKIFLDKEFSLIK